MTGEAGAKGAPRPRTDERAQGQDVLGLGERERDALLAWVGENLTLVRRSASGQRILYWSLGIGFVAGLAAHVGGFLLKSWATTEPLLLVGDLLYTLGWALWTGAVVVVFTQIYPETKRRQYTQALDAYEAAAGDQARAGSGRILPASRARRTSRSSGTARPPTPGTRPRCSTWGPCSRAGQEGPGRAVVPQSRRRRERGGDGQPGGPARRAGQGGPGRAVVPQGR